MERDSQRLFERIQFLGSVTVLYIKIPVIVIMNEIQTVAGTLLTRWVSIGNPECCCLNSNKERRIDFKCCFLNSDVLLSAIFSIFQMKIFELILSLFQHHHGICDICLYNKHPPIGFSAVASFYVPFPAPYSVHYHILRQQHIRVCDSNIDYWIFLSLLIIFLCYSIVNHFIDGT